MVAWKGYSVQMEHTVEIKKIITGGKGLGYLPDGMVAMVPFTLPGEIVHAREIRRFSGYVAMEAIEIQAPSRQRRIPPCPLFGTCGGCALQHAAYNLQLESKKNILLENLQRNHVHLTDATIHDTVPSPETFHYRYRVRLHLAANGTLGFHRQLSNEVVSVERCPLTTDPINQAITFFRTLAEQLAPNCSAIELLQSPLDDQIIAVLHLRKKMQVTNNLMELLAGHDSISALFSKEKHQLRQFTPRQHNTILRQKFTLPDHSYMLSWDCGCFFQVNAAQNARLVDLVCQLAGNLHHQQVLDLYCGMGNFSLPLAYMGAHVLGIEQNRGSITWAKQNADQAGLPHCSFQKKMVASALAELSTNGEQFDLVVLDPPRQGVGKAMQLLAALNAQRIISISCDPATLARDLRVLTDCGYSVRSVFPVDMFPQTHHIESVVLLEKN